MRTPSGEGTGFVIFMWNLFLMFQCSPVCEGFSPFIEITIGFCLFFMIKKDIVKLTYVVLIFYPTNNVLSLVTFFDGKVSLNQLRSLLPMNTQTKPPAIAYPLSLNFSLQYSTQEKCLAF